MPSKVVRPIQFDAKRKERRNTKARDAKRKRDTERTRLWRFMYRMIEPYCEWGWDHKRMTGINRQPMNDNAARPGK